MTCSRSIRSSILMLMILTGSFVLKAQQKKVITLRAMKVGDTLLPGIPMKQMINYPEPKATFGDFRGKWLILDYWAINCPACILEMPLMDTLSRKFSDKLNIVLVSINTAEQVDKLLNERKEVVKGAVLPFSLRDTLVTRLFPHRIIPHEVWIDPDGIVRAITDSYQVNEENIRKMISGEITTLPLKDDFPPESNSKISALADSFFIGHSFLLKYRAGIGSRFGDHLDSTTGQRRLFFQNLPAASLFHNLFNRMMDYGSNLNRMRISMEITDSALYEIYARPVVERGRFSPHPKHFPFLHWQDHDAYAKEMLFSYEYITPPNMPDSLRFSYAMADMNRYFPIKARIEKRKVPCWILVADSSAHRRLATKGGERKYILNTDSVGVVNRDFYESLFSYGLSRFMDHPQIIDETGFAPDFKVDFFLDLSGSPYHDRKNGLVVNTPLHYQTVKEQLAKYGLQLHQDWREIPILVIYNE